ncbi:hypothetical protein ABER68_05025 [Paenibacillus alvei]
MNKKDIKQIALRLPTGIAEQLVNEARQLNVPLHSLIIMIIKNHTDKSKKSVYESNDFVVIKHK